jgi:hypothetical protein
MKFEADLLGYMAGTYLSFIDISCDVLLEAYLLYILVHAFGIWIGDILGHVVGELMRWSCYTSLMSHSLIYSLCMIGTLLVHWQRHLLAV